MPALITGILSSEPGGPLFDRAIAELYELSRLPATRNITDFEIELPQVHAMNCLKDIFTDARFGPHTQSYIISALEISSESLSSSMYVF